MPTEPVYECRDNQPALVALMVLLVVAMLGMAVFMPNDPKAPVWAMWALRFTFLFFGLLTLVILPTVRLRAFPEYIEIGYGLTPLIRFRLAKSKITRVEAVTYNPIIDFGGWGIKGGGGKWKTYTAFTASMTSKALAIQTTEKNYLIGCSDPEEAETMIRNLLRP